MPDSTLREFQTGTASLPLTFVAALRCPLSAQRLEALPADSLKALGFAGLRTEGWSGALLTEDRRALYPVRGGIPVLLGEERITVTGAGGSIETGG